MNILILYYKSYKAQYGLSLEYLSELKNEVTRENIRFRQDLFKNAYSLITIITFNIFP